MTSSSSNIIQINLIFGIFQITVGEISRRSLYGVWCGVFEGVEDGHGVPSLQAGKPETTVSLFQIVLPLGRRRVEHGRP
jgi:hypothetical protein